MPVPVTDKNRLPLHTISPGIRAEDTEVILILDSEKAIEISAAQFKSDLMNGPDSFKLSYYKKFLGNIPAEPLELPIIYYNTKPHVRFCDGRHRTTVLVGNGLRTVPVLTSKNIAEGLTRLWGSKQIALSEYDFSQCSTKTILGV